MRCYVVTNKGGGELVWWLPGLSGVLTRPACCLAGVV